jgi:hypothetical protein
LKEAILGGGVTESQKKVFVVFGEDVWNAECEGGDSFGVISRADGNTDVLECAAAERDTGTACWEKF